MLRFSAAGVTHRGLVRPDNEDSGYSNADLIMVADGVGGGAAGEVASATTTYAVVATATARRDDDPAAVLADAVQVAQAQLADGVRRDRRREGMATTLTAFLTDGVRCALAHIGDSRGYVFRDAELTRVTHDHTYVAQLVEDGRISEVDVAHHPWRNVVLRSINADTANQADIVPLALRPGDRLLVASDGLTDLVTEPEIANVLASSPDDSALQRLVELALKRGGRDNVTVVGGTVVDGPRVAADGQIIGAAADPANVVDPTAVRVRRTA